MSAPWFIAPQPAWGAGRVLLDEDESHHALKVLRLRPGAAVVACDGRGRLASCRVGGPEQGRLVLDIVAEEHRAPRRPQVAVYQAAPKNPKADAIVERLAELGVAEVVMVMSERAVVRWDETKRKALEARWGSIARSAAKQSRNPYVLQAPAPLDWDEALARLRAEPAALTLWEEATMPLRDLLPAAPDRIALVVGPEGGLTAEEAGELRSAGAAPGTLGAAILRTENAALVAAACVLWHYRAIG